MKVVGMAYSTDYRQAVRAYDQGASSSEVAEEYGCNESWERRLIQQRCLRRTLEPRPTVRKTSQRIVDKQDEQVIRQLIAEKPDATLAEVTRVLAKPIHPGTVWRRLALMNLPRKKSPCTPANGSVPT